MNPDDVGLIEKYLIFKKCEDDSCWTQKRTWSFVLSPKKDDDYGLASKCALETYANVIEKKNPHLAGDIRRNFGFTPKGPELQARIQSLVQRWESCAQDLDRMNHDDFYKQLGMENKVRWELIKELKKELR